MSPIPAILSSIADHNQGEVEAVPSPSKKSMTDIQTEIKNTALDICTKKGDDLSTGLDGLKRDLDNSEFIPPPLDSARTNGPTSPTASTTSGSIISATSSTKENQAPPRKKSRTSTSRGLTMTYTPKRKRASKNNTARKRGRRASTSSNVTVSSVNSDRKPMEEQKEKEASDKSDSESDSDSDDDNKTEDVYVVERIDGKQVVDGVTYYFIKWKGWEETANTWEPIDHLDGCAELLADFDRREKEKKASKRRPARVKGRMRDSDEDEEEVLNETRQNMRSYGVLAEWPADKEPLSVEGVITVDGVLTYIVKRKARLGSRMLDRTNAVLVHSESFRKWYPELIIAFYQSRIVWNGNEKSGEEKADLAAQMTLLHQNKKSNIGREIVSDIDKQLKTEYNDMIMEVDTEEEKSASLPSAEENENAKEEMETQIIEMEEDVLDINAPSDEFNELDNEILQETQPAITTRKDQDLFGLPEDLEDTDVSADSDSEIEFEEINNLMSGLKAHAKTGCK